MSSINESCLYKWTNLVNGKEYIGRSDRPYNCRKREHEFCFTHSKKPLYASMRKYGINSFSFVVLFEGLSVSESKHLEKVLIRQRNTKSPNGYNLTDGGEGCLGFRWTEELKDKLRGREFSETTREKLRLAKLGVPNTEESKEKNRVASTGVNNPFYGRKHSPEVIQRLSGVNNPMFGRSGESNPMYGKKHSDFIKEHLRNIKLKVVPAITTNIKILHSLGATQAQLASWFNIGKSTAGRHINDNIGGKRVRFQDQ